MAAWITYQPDLSGDAIDKLQELGSQAYTLVSTREVIDSPIVISAWGDQLIASEVEDPRIEAFLDAYREGPNTPELGAPCSGGVGPGVIRRLAMVAAAAVAMVVVLSALPSPGSDDNPPAEDSADAGFARDMAFHQAQAVEMAEILRDRTDDASLRSLATDIALTQQAQIGMRGGWLDVWGLNRTSWRPNPCSGPACRWAAAWSRFACAYPESP